MIDRAGLHGAEGLFHFVEAVGVAVKSRKIEPGARASVTGINGGAIFLFRSGVVFIFLSDASLDPVRHGWIQRSEEFNLGERFIFAAADNAGRFQIKLSKVGAGFPTVGRELDGALEFGAHFARQSGGLEETGAVRLLAVGAAEPQMVETVVGIEHGRFFAGGNTGVPSAEFKMRAAEQVVAFRSGSGADLPLQRLQGLVDGAGSQEILRSLS